ncbi:unnamed protein product [Clavelina lepadiformis]|uniref:Uncharacterized protein n=1 Tax=Clavelina lepadiformis TaxID=159417 RepID=A0ABP0F1G2_CLALP
MSAKAQRNLPVAKKQTSSKQDYKVSPDMATKRADRKGPSKSANQIEQNRALRSVQTLHKNLKMPIPQLPAVLAYLRWLDKMEAWNGKKYPSSINELRLKDSKELYSWGDGFQNPIVLPEIKKYPDSEKFRSTQIKARVFQNPKEGKNRQSDYDNRIRLSSKEFEASSKSQGTLSDYYRPDVWKRPSPEASKSRKVSIKIPTKARSASDVRNNGKPTAFYVHAKNGFKYWPSELYKPPVPSTKYSFGERFNPGRAGVITDRIYAKPRTNLHYWTEFQQHQNPIGSGNILTGKVLSN